MVNDRVLEQWPEREVLQSGLINVMQDDCLRHGMGGTFNPQRWTPAGRWCML